MLVESKPLAKQAPCAISVHRAPQVTFRNNESEPRPGQAVGAQVYQNGFVPEAPARGKRPTDVAASQTLALTVSVLPRQTPASDRKSRPALGTACPDHSAPTPRAHPDEKTVGAFSLGDRGLESAFHRWLPL